jgi:mitogen-activated protein kinase kinase 1
MLLGLSFLHDTARICHRDVKPSNLLLSSRGQLKISDFGTSSQLSNSMSRCLSWVGTVTYMSPERIRGDSYGFNTDVWSLGLLVLECALGRYPYPPLQHGASNSGTAAAAAPPPKLGFWELLEYIGRWAGRSRHCVWLRCLGKSEGMMCLLTP